MRGLFLFASEEAGPHISLKAEEVTKIGDIPITNAMIYGVFVALVMMVVGVYVARRASVKPQKGLLGILEIMMEFIVNMLEGVFNNRDKAYKYAPIFGTFFVFILINNIAGLMPIVGEGINVGGTPVFRPFTADLNGTLALSVIAIITVQYYSIKESGFMGHLKHYFTDKPWNPINFFIGILEVFGEFTRIASLALRLFLNTAVGEILIAVFAYVGAYFGSLTILPIAVFEILVALIQAYVFTILSATYLGLAIAHGHDEDHAEEAHETAKLSPSEVTS